MAPPENDPHHHAAEAAQHHPAAEAPQYQAALAQYEDAPAHNDPHTDVVDTHQTDTSEAEAPQNCTPDPATAHTPHNPVEEIGILEAENRWPIFRARWPNCTVVFSALVHEFSVAEWMCSVAGLNSKK